MTVTDFVLMAALVISTTFGLFMKVSETGYFDWELEPHSKLGMLLENQRQDILARGVEAITLSGSDPVGGYNPTDAVMAAYFAGLRYPHIDEPIVISGYWVGQRLMRRAKQILEGYQPPRLEVLTCL